MRAKKAQSWGIDLMVGLTLFLIGIISFYLLSINTSDEANNTIKTLSYEGQVISDSLLSEGFPLNWTSDNVVSIGITHNGKIDQTKLEQFYNLSNKDYKLTKVLLNTNSEYYFTLSEPIIINGTVIDGIGLKNDSASNLIKTTRFTIYKDKPVSIILKIWK